MIVREDWIELSFAVAWRGHAEQGKTVEEISNIQPGTWVDIDAEGMKNVRESGFGEDERICSNLDICTVVQKKSQGNRIKIQGRRRGPGTFLFGPFPVSPPPPRSPNLELRNALVLFQWSQVAVRGAWNHPAISQDSSFFLARFDQENRLERITSRRDVVALSTIKRGTTRKKSRKE